MAAAAYTLLVELVLTPLVWGPRRVRRVVFVAMAAMQATILLTANYGFFNYLSVALALFILDDRDLDCLAARLGRPLRPSPPRVPSRVRTVLLAAVAAILVPLSVIPFLPFLGVRAVGPAHRAIDTVQNEFDVLAVQQADAGQDLEVIRRFGSQLELGPVDARLWGIDRAEARAQAVRQGFASDVLVISGGVSAGAFDLV